MKRKIMWLLLSCLMVVSLVLASCAEAEVEEEEKVAPPPPKEEEAVVEEEVVPAVDEPQYGGSLTFTVTQVATEIFDPGISSKSAETAILSYGRLGIADWARGPAGTNEFAFSSSIIPLELQAGDIAESWEQLDLHTARLRIRKGIYFQNVPPVNGRQVTADDVIYTFRRNQTIPQNIWYASPAMPEEQKATITKIDDWTVEVWYYDSSVDMISGLLSFVYIVPHEMVEEYGDLDDWRYQCGSGPFILEDVVVGSSVNWRRNPNYWMNDPVHPENRLPYIDIIRALVIPDESTRLAALRTYKIDRLGVAWDKAGGIKKTSPELLSRRVLPTASQPLFMRTDIDPFSDKRVRWAISLAIDQPTIIEQFYMGDAYILTWPIMPNFVAEYTPVEELPDELRELFEYHPDKARQLLAEAGYPDGFKTEVIVPVTSPRWIDVMAIVQSQLAEVGIDVELNVLESATFVSTIYGKKYPGMIYTWWENNGLVDAIGWANGGWVQENEETGEVIAHSMYAFGNVVDPIARDAFVLYNETLDADERARQLKAENVRQIDMCWEVVMPAPAFYLFWVPWLKGYHGELGLGPDYPENSGVYIFIWIDQDLKEEMTGRRGIIK